MRRECKWLLENSLDEDLFTELCNKYAVNFMKGSDDESKEHSDAGQMALDLGSDAGSNKPSADANVKPSTPEPKTTPAPKAPAKSATDSKK